MMDLGLAGKSVLIAGAGRGIGAACARMFVAAGAREKLLAHERDAFLGEEWPRLRVRIKSLGLDLSALLKESGE